MAAGIDALVAAVAFFFSIPTGILFAMLQEERQRHRATMRQVAALEKALDGLRLRVKP